MKQTAFNPSEKFSEAVKIFHQGRLSEAAELCRSIMAQTAPNPICLHLMGVIHHQQRKFADAETWLSQAVDLQPNGVEVNFNLGLALLAQDKNESALSYFKKSVELNPAYAVGYFQLGNAYKNLENPEQAVESYRRCLDHSPEHVEALNCLGVCLCQLNRHAEAIVEFQRVLSIKPDYPEAFNNMGVAYLELDQFDQAQASCARAIELRPDYSAALNNLGNALKSEGDYDEAINFYQRALTHNPDLVEAKNNLGLSYMYGHSSVDTAMSVFRQILAQNPNNPHALNNLGIALCHEGDFAQGIACYEKALTIDPSYTDAKSNLACAYRATHRIDEALNLFQQVVADKPNHPEAHNNLAMSLLSIGRFDEGWHEYEWRWKTSQLKDSARIFDRPAWNGEDLRNKTLLIYSEQGFGDTLQFCRYANDVKLLGTKIIMQVQPALVRLIQSMPSIDSVIPEGSLLPEFDYHCAMLSLPRILKTQTANPPDSTPYLYAYDGDISTWAAKIPTSKTLKIGLVWAGNPRKYSFDLAATDLQRSMDSRYFSDLAKIDGVEFHSLQKDATAQDDLHIVDYMNECHDFADTAALIMQLDLVISVDTSVAHLVGALGKPIWLLNRFDTCWRWHYGRDTSAWYPQMRIFRQPKFGDWVSVISEVKSQLLQTVKNL